MSKKKHRGLFSPQNQKVSSSQPNNDASSSTNAEVETASSFDHNIVRNELISVLIFVVIIVIAFSVIRLTDVKKPWISQFSDSILRLTVKNF